jgi:hypothetical protein
MSEAKFAAGEGSVSALSLAERDPHPPTMLRISGTLSRKGRGCTADAA